MNRPQARRRAAGKIGPWAAYEEKPTGYAGGFLFICRGFLSGRVTRDRRRTSFEGAKGRAKDSETATQRRDRKLLIKGKDLQRCESFLHA